MVRTSPASTSTTRPPQHIAARTTEGYNKTYGIVHPMEQWGSNRPIRISRLTTGTWSLGAEFFEAAGWERPFWYGTNECAPGRVRQSGDTRGAEWESRCRVADHR